MNLRPLEKSVQGNLLVEPFEVEDGLTLEKVTNYIVLLVNQGFIFKSARITSSSDKDTWQSFSGRETYSEYEPFINMLRSEELKDELEVSVSLSGEINRIKRCMDFYIDRSRVILNTVLDKDWDLEIVGDQTELSQGRER